MCVILNHETEWCRISASYLNNRGNKEASCVSCYPQQNGRLTVIDDSLIFCSTISRAEKPSSRKENSGSVFMVTRSPFDWSLVNWKRAGKDIEIVFSVKNSVFWRTDCCPFWESSFKQCSSYLKRKEMEFNVAVPQVQRGQGGSPVKLNPFK